MGVITVAYSISPKLMRKIRADNDNLAYIFGDCEDENEAWKVESYDFDKGIEEIISILHEADCKKTAKNIDCENYFYSDNSSYLDYDGYDVWTIPPSKVKAMLKELEKVNVTELKNKGNINGITDRRGTLLPESLYQSYVGDLKTIRKFFQKTVEQGNYLLFAEA
ncbi:MAG TPA: DUF1877 family protein [Pyrinomonadaceae bacterium]|nr:DUF1877 family protein [Pyrinomonadaceae bacterium]